jgi:hypothetical protein
MRDASTPRNQRVSVPSSPKSLGFRLAKAGPVAHFGHTESPRDLGDRTLVTRILCRVGDQLFIESNDPISAASVFENTGYL